MTKFSVIIAPDNRLRLKTKPVKKITPAHLQIFKDMIKLTKTFVDPEGVGLASNQIGLDEQYFVIKNEDDSFKCYINPVITKFSPQTKTYFEGCLSLPTTWGETIRSTWVDVKYLDINGQEKNERLKGFIAWVFQHECDHLQGKLFLDRVLEQKGKLFKVSGKDRTGADIFEEVPL